MVYILSLQSRLGNEVRALAVHPVKSWVALGDEVRAVGQAHTLPRQPHATTHAYEIVAYYSIKRC